MINAFWYVIHMYVILPLAPISKFWRISSPEYKMLSANGGTKKLSIILFIVLSSCNFSYRFGIAGKDFLFFCFILEEAVIVDFVYGCFNLPLIQCNALASCDALNCSLFRKLSVRCLSSNCFVNVSSHLVFNEIFYAVPACM